MFWMLGVLCCGWVSRGASTCGAIALTPAGGDAAIVDGTEVLKFCKTVGLLMVAVVQVATPEATTVCTTVFAPATLTAADVRIALWLLCEMLAGVCIGGLTSVTVGTLFTVDWVETASEAGALAEEVRMIVLGAAGEAAAVPLLAETGPLLTGVVAGCELLLSTDAALGM